MPILSPANIKRAYYYFRRNGIVNTYYAVTEELAENRREEIYPPVSSCEELEIQRKQVEDWKAEGFYPKFSIVVPAYRTPEPFLIKLLDTCMGQTYSNLELVIADASGDDSVKSIIDLYAKDNNENRIVYHELEKNAGISDNTNVGINLASGDYIALLDHDDILTLDALYYVAEKFKEARKKGQEYSAVYTDECKCDGEGEHFYEPNIKPDFNGDYLLSNNYICHFLVVKGQLMKQLLQRSAYDGAQDYDLLLRIFNSVGANRIGHVARILYYWRCHDLSTAANPMSKAYAYNAGELALADYVKNKGWAAKVRALRHVGFYRVDFIKDPLGEREDLGAVGGRILAKNVRGKVLSGAMKSDGTALYAGMAAAHSGYLHRGVLTQNVEALDIRCLHLRKELWGEFEKITGVKYTEKSVDNKRNFGLLTENVVKMEWERVFDYSTLPQGTDYKDLSLKISEMVRQKGYELLYDPSLETLWKK